MTIAKRIKSPWCELSSFDFPEPELIWRTIPGGKPFACNDFWSDFDWNRPKKGQELRFVFSNAYVRGAQKTLVRNDLFGRNFVLESRATMGMYSPMLELLYKLEPRELFEFNVWWWLEYRDGGAK